MVDGEGEGFRPLPSFTEGGEKEMKKVTKKKENLDELFEAIRSLEEITMAEEPDDWDEDNDEADNQT